MQINEFSFNYKRSLLRGIIAIVLGLVLVIWPTHVLNYTVKIIGAVFCITGIVSLLISIRENREASSSGLVSFTGIGSILFGLLLWFMADAFTNLLMFVLGFVLILVGTGQLSMLISSRRYGRMPWASYLFPFMILLVGVIIFINPFEAKQTIIIIFGITTIFSGITDIFNQYTVNKMRQKIRDEEQQQRLGTTDIEDTDFEEVDE